MSRIVRVAQGGRGFAAVLRRNASSSAPKAPAAATEASKPAFDVAQRLKALERNQPRLVWAKVLLGGAGGLMLGAAGASKMAKVLDEDLGLFHYEPEDDDDDDDDDEDDDEEDDGKDDKRGDNGSEDGESSEDVPDSKTKTAAGSADDSKVEATAETNTEAAPSKPPATATKAEVKEPEEAPEVKPKSSRRHRDHGDGGYGEARSAASQFGDVARLSLHERIDNYIVVFEQQLLSARNARVPLLLDWERHMLERTEVALQSNLDALEARRHPPS